VNGNCTFTPISCDDNNMCTDDHCDPRFGCVFTPINVAVACSDGNACTIDWCNATLGCLHADAPEPEPIDRCHAAYCDKVLGSVSQAVVCRPSDSCVCKPTEGCVCVGASTPKTNKKEQIGIMAAIIAAIAVLVIAFIVAAAFVAKKAKAMRASLAANAAPQNLVSDNPLYESKGGLADNPLYTPLE